MGRVRTLETKATGGSGGCVGQRPMRADAVRNRARVIEAAEVVFAAEGIDAPIDLIAEKAGVGVGTLYRHFPTKEKLFEAIVIDKVEALSEEALCRAHAEDPEAAFFGFLTHMAEESASKRDLIQALGGPSEAFESSMGPVKDRMKCAIGELLRRAQEVGAVRADVDVEQVMSLVGGTCMAASMNMAQPVDVMGLLEIIFAGLRAQPAG